MDGWSDQHQLLLLFALILLAAWALGGGFEFKGFKIPQLNAPSRLFSALTGGALLLIWLLIFFASLDIADVPDTDDPVKAEATTAPSIEPTAVPPPVVGDDIRADINRAIEFGAESESLVYETGDSSYFQGYFTGQALDDVVNTMTTLQYQGIVREVLERSWTMEQIELTPDGNRAEVAIRMTFRDQFYAVWNWECTEYLNAENASVRMTLEKVSPGSDTGGWVISSMNLGNLENYLYPGCSPFL